MKPMNMELREQVAATLKAMAHPTRILLLEALFIGERCVCELVPLTRADFSTVSKHLTLLKTAGLLKSRKQDLNVYYSIAAQEVEPIIRLSRAGVKAKAIRFLKAANG